MSTFLDVLDFKEAHIGSFQGFGRPGYRQIFESGRPLSL